MTLTAAEKVLIAHVLRTAADGGFVEEDLDALDLSEVTEETCNVESTAAVDAVIDGRCRFLEAECLRLADLFT